MKKKYFFFDIDGTLTNKETGEMIESAKKAIDLLQKEGHFVSIATGRAYYKTKDFAQNIGIHHIVSNGGAAITLNDSLIENKPLEHDKAVRLIEEAEKCGFGVLVAFNDSIDVIMKNELFLEQVGYRQEPTRYIYDQSLDYEKIKEIYKIYIAIPQEKENLLTLRDTLGHIRFAKDYLTYQHDAKDEGIMRMLELVNGNKEDVVVFGDDYNDLVMFKDWTNIAMGNACEELKEKATFVTRESYNDGIYYACQHFGWIGKEK